MKKKPKSFLLRMRAKDTPVGISMETLERLSSKLGIDKTAVVHLALRKMADEYLGYQSNQLSKPTSTITENKND